MKRSSKSERIESDFCIKGELACEKDKVGMMNEDIRNRIRFSVISVWVYFNTQR